MRRIRPRDVVLQTQRLVFRPWLPDDWLRFQPIATDPYVVRYALAGQVPSDEEIQRHIEAARQRYREEGLCLWPLIHRANEELIGFCGLDHLWGGDEIEIGYWLAPAYWGRGLATEAARAVLDYGFGPLAIPRIVAVTHPQNSASVRVLDKLGMKYEKTVAHQGIEHLYFAQAATLLRSSPLSS